jgi:ribA/ribD-fused uncharacterized protein
MEISFTKVNLPYGWLGNMAPYPVEYGGKQYRTTEALFQVLRFQGFPDIQEKIREQKSPMSAKMIAKGNKHLIPDYEFCGTQDIEHMELCLRLKLEQHPQLKEDLLATKDYPIIENCSSRPHGTGLIWGAAFINNEWQGQNILGKLWEKIRKELI